MDELQVLIPSTEPRMKELIKQLHADTGNKLKVDFYLYCQYFIDIGTASIFVRINRGIWRRNAVFRYVTEKLCHIMITEVPE